MKKLRGGKTKIILRLENSENIVKIVSKNTITAKDGEKKDIMPGKARLANNTTSNVFELLTRHGIDTHFIRRAGQTSFFACECDMIPVEVVARRIAKGSYLKRNPKVADGTIFDELVMEFFYKDDELHDPMICISEIAPEEWQLHRADRPIDFSVYVPYRSLSYIKTIGSHFTWKEADYIEEQAKQIFLILEKAWKALGITLLDFKIEFGRRKDNGKIIIADVIDNDSWRVRTKDGKQLDKQVYREGGELKEVSNLYEIVSNLTNRFPTLNLQ